MNSFSTPSFSSTSFVASPQRPISKREILKEIETQKKVEEAKSKPLEERNLNDKLTILQDVVTKLTDVPVCHANGNCSRMNYFA